jgi:signal transduction histidine kinase
MGQRLPADAGRLTSVVDSGPLYLPPPPMPHSRSIFRVLLRRAVLFTLLALAMLLSITVWDSWKATERSLAATVNTDIAGLADIYATGGENELLKRLDDRSQLIGLEGRQARYLAMRPDGKRLAGDIAEWPGLNAALSQQGFVTLSDGTSVYARATRLAPDLNIVVARSYQRDWQVLLRLIALFGVGALVIVVTSWMLARRATGNLRRRVNAITRAFRAAELGNPPELPDSAFDDEIGELAELSTRSISRSASLAQTHRKLSDHIAHEIRTPLTHLDQRLVAALRSLPEGADTSMLEQGRQDIRGVVAMLDSLLDIASSEARVGDPVGLADVDLSALAENLLDLYEGSAEEAGITLRSFVAPGVHLLGEPMQLTRLLSNLLDNALKYVPRGGLVTLSVTPGPVIEVRDDGPGIEPALRSSVFARFTKGSASTGSSSHGLGLALARAIALRHGMDIRLADSAAGAHFVIKPHGMWGVEDNVS